MTYRHNGEKNSRGLTLVLASQNNMTTMETTDIIDNKTQPLY